VQEIKFKFKILDLSTFIQEIYETVFYFQTESLDVLSCRSRGNRIWDRSLRLVAEVPPEAMSQPGEDCATGD